MWGVLWGRLHAEPQKKSQWFFLNIKIKPFWITVDSTNELQLQNELCKLYSHVGIKRHVFEQPGIKKEVKLKRTFKSFLKQMKMEN